MRSFSQVDVFSAEPLLGNPVAVVHDADGLERRADGAVRPLDQPVRDHVPAARRPAPGADYRLRILTPGGELPFAGHPTLGSAHAWLEAGGVPATEGEVVQECGAGLVRLPGPRGPSRPAGLRGAAAAALGSGRRRRTAPGSRGRCGSTSRRDRRLPLDRQRPRLGRRAAARTPTPCWRCDPDTAAFGDLEIGVVGPYADGATDAHCEVRAFVPGDGHRRGPGHRQPQRRHRPVAGRRPAARVVRRLAGHRARAAAGRVHVEPRGGQIWVGGDTSTTIRGEVDL